VLQIGNARRRRLAGAGSSHLYEFPLMAHSVVSLLCSSTSGVGA